MRRCAPASAGRKPGEHPPRPPRGLRTHPHPLTRTSNANRRTKHHTENGETMDRQDDAPFGVPGTIYLIHFDTPYRHARHYMGFTTNLPQRIKRHKAGRGSR